MLGVGMARDDVLVVVQRHVPKIAPPDLPPLMVAQVIAATGGDGSRRDSAASRNHCAGVMCICAALSRNAPYSLGDTRTPMVVVRTAAGSPLGRPPLALRSVASLFMTRPQAVA